MGAEENKFASEQKRLLMVKNNQVLLISGSDNSTPPTLSPGEGVRCYYYGEEKTEPFLVEDTSQLHIEIPAKTEEASIQVRIAADKMSAEVKVSPQKIIKCRLKDQSATSNLTLIIELEEIQEKPYFAKEDIMRKIKEEGVNYGFDEKILEVLAVRPDDRWYTVAKGKPPQAGRDGYVEILVEHEVKTVSYGQGLQKVDYRERINLPMVAEGDILARIHPPLEGEPGYNVIGEEIKPPPVKEAYYRCKKGAAVDTDDKGNLIIKATQKGRPLVEGKQKNIFSVSPLYHHAGDVDIKSGNLKFAGDLSISGNILEGMRVEAEGDLVVAGNTAGAEIFSGGNVIFHRNLINSRVQAGLKKAFYQEVFVLLKEFDELLEAVIAGLDQLRESMQSMGKDMPDKQIGKLIQLMVEKRYAKMPVVAAKISKLVKESRINVFTNLKESILGVVKYFTGYGFLDIKNQDHLLILSGNLRDAIESVERNLGLSGDITASYVQNSRVMAGGNIYIKGPGSYNSFFKAGGDVEISGILRGGEIISRGNVILGEAGSPQVISKQGLVKVPSKSIIQMQKVFENFEVHVGKKVYRFIENMTRVKISYDKESDSIKVSHF